MPEIFRLPGSSYDGLVKIIKAYGVEKIDTVISLDSIAKSTGMDKTNVSRNNGFLSQIGVVTSGNKKTLTPLGSDLGRAYNNKIDIRVLEIWKDIISNDDFLNRMVSAIRIRGGMERTSFINHILYSSGSSTNNNTKAGANTIIEILKVAKLVIENDGKISVSEDIGITETTQNSSSKPKSQSDSLVEYKNIEKRNSSISITINVNVDLKKDDIDEVTSKLKKLIQSLEK